MQIIDTDVVIDHFHGHRAALEYFAMTLSSGQDLAISVVTLTELTSGMRSGEEERTEQLLRLFTILDVNTQVGRLAGTYLRQYHRSHHVELGDVLIAATAALATADLVTRNIRHYPMQDIHVIVPYNRGQ